jgi:hypothetical protein
MKKMHGVFWWFKTHITKTFEMILARVVTEMGAAHHLMQRNAKILCIPKPWRR